MPRARADRPVPIGAILTSRVLGGSLSPDWHCIQPHNPIISAGMDAQAGAHSTALLSIDGFTHRRARFNGQVPDRNSKDEQPAIDCGTLAGRP